jgi:hypothetical protein
MDQIRVRAGVIGSIGAEPSGALQVAVAVLAERPSHRPNKDDNDLRDSLEMDILRAEAEAALANAAPR